MNIVSLANELGQFHIDYAKLLTKIAGSLSVNGQIGMLFIMNRKDLYAISIIRQWGLTPVKIANNLKKLKQPQLINRDEYITDQRKLCFSLTKKGISMIYKTFRQMNLNPLTLLSALGIENALREIIKALNSIGSFLKFC